MRHLCPPRGAGTVAAPARGGPRWRPEVPPCRTTSRPACRCPRRPRGPGRRWPTIASSANGSAPASTAPSCRGGTCLSGFVPRVRFLYKRLFRYTCSTCRRAAVMSCMWVVGEACQRIDRANIERSFATKLPVTTASSLRRGWSDHFPTRLIGEEWQPLARRRCGYSSMAREVGSQSGTILRPSSDDALCMGRTGRFHRKGPHLALDCLRVRSCGLLEPSPCSGRSSTWTQPPSLSA